MGMLKKELVVFGVFLCVVFLLYKYNLNDSNIIACKNLDMTKHFKAAQQPINDQYIIPDTSVYSQSSDYNVKTNPLKYTVQTRQEELDNERYGTKIDKRQNITNYCRKHMAKNPFLQRANSRVGLKTQLVYFDFAHSFLFCQMQKVGSSTWNTILLRIRDIKNVRRYQSEESELGVVASRKRHFLRDTMYNLPNGFNLSDVKSRLVAFTFTRHPYSRLVSAYNSKIKTIIKRNDKFFNEDIARIQNTILSQYRKSSSMSDPPYPTPTEFIKYLLDKVSEKGPMSLNPHFQPQYGLCPFCLAEFDFIGDLEYMKEDIAFLGKTLSISKQVSLTNINENSHSDFIGFMSEKDFFKSVPQQLIKDLYERVYKPDFELLGYPKPTNYIAMGYS